MVKKKSFMAIGFQDIIRVVLMEWQGTEDGMVVVGD